MRPANSGAKNTQICSTENFRPIAFNPQHMSEDDVISPGNSVLPTTRPRGYLGGSSW